MTPASRLYKNETVLDSSSEITDNVSGDDKKDDDEEIFDFAELAITDPEEYERITTGGDINA